jgi:DNA-binding transcriptional MerR regulator
MPRTPPPKPGTYATNEELIAITGVSRDALYKWVREELLPRPAITSDGNGTISLWPLEALERARFIMEKRAQMYTLLEIKKMIQKRWPTPAATEKPDEEL